MKIKTKLKTDLKRGYKVVIALPIIILVFISFILIFAIPLKDILFYKRVEKN